MLSSLACIPSVFKLITRTMLTGAELHVIQGHPPPLKKYTNILSTFYTHLHCDLNVLNNKIHEKVKLKMKQEVVIFIDL